MFPAALFSNSEVGIDTKSILQEFRPQHYLRSSTGGHV
jgi:hypothetical protein